MEGFKNTTRMKTFGDVAPQAYAKGGSVKPAAKVGKVMSEFAEGKLHSGSKTGPKVTNKKQAIAIGISEAKKAGAKGPMKKANGGEIVRMTDAERRASLEVPSRGMTPAEARALRATMAAKAAAPKREPLIGRGTISDRDEGRALRAMPKNSNPMSPAEVRRLIEMDRPTNKMGAEAYKGGGKVGASKVPFAVKKVMRKAEGGAVNQPPPILEMPKMPKQPAPPPPSVMPTLETMQGYGNNTPPASASDIIRAQQAAEMMRLMGGTSPGPSPEMPQEPTPQSVFGGPAVAIPTSMGGMAASLYGNPSTPMPSAPKSAFNENDILGMMSSGASQQQLQDAMSARIRAENPNPLPTQTRNRGVPENLTWYNNMVKETLAARDAQNAARAQVQQMQEQRDAAQIRREAAPRFMR